MLKEGGDGGTTLTPALGEAEAGESVNSRPAGSTEIQVSQGYNRKKLCLKKMKQKRL